VPSKILLKLNFDFSHFSITRCVSTTTLKTENKKQDPLSDVEASSDEYPVCYEMPEISNVMATEL
jgi:hypothetical protein